MVKKSILLLLIAISFGLFAQKNDGKLTEKKSDKAILMDKKSDKKIVKNEKLEVILQKIKKNYENVNILEADFKQVFHHKAYNRKKHSSGKVVFTKDLKMKWSYKSPEEKYIISNNKILWIYEPENSQAFKTKIKGTELESAGKFLLGRLDVLKKYNISVEKNIIKLTPKKENNYKVIYLTLSKDYRILKTKMIDNFDNENIITYMNLKINQSKPSNDFFNFTPPKNIEIIEKDK